MPPTKTKAGFTLAEVLVTLGIIGVISAMTIPSLITKYNERATVTKVKEIYSIIAQAMLLVEPEYGTPECWDLNGSNYSSEDSLKIAEKILPSIKVVHDCGTKPDSSCMYKSPYKYLNGKTAGNYGSRGLYKIILLNGASIAFGKWSDNELIDFFIDVNGTKPPNQIGKDLFLISYYAGKGLFPLGSPETGYDCSISSTGWGCAYYIIKFGNMNYLH